MFAKGVSLRVRHTSLSKEQQTTKNRRKSESDLSEIDHLKKLNINELNGMFEKMLNDMNLSEDKKVPLRCLDIDQKRNMIIMHHKSTHQTKNQMDANLSSPSEFIKFLNTPNLNGNKISKCLDLLKIKLNNSPISWLQEFGTEGLSAMVSTLSKSNAKYTEYNDIRLKCLMCLVLMMNNKCGAMDIINHKDVLVEVANNLDTSKPKIILEAFKILSTASLVQPNGHEKVLEAINIRGETLNEDRFDPIIKGLYIGKLLTLHGFMLINALILSTTELHHRIQLRNEMFRSGLRNAYEELTKDSNNDIALQLEHFNDSMMTDYEEYKAIITEVCNSFNNIEECFEIVKHSVIDTPSEQYLLFILQDLLYIDDDPIERSVYYKLISGSIQQIILREYEPDFSPEGNIQLNIESIINNEKDKKKIIEYGKKLDELEKQVESALQRKKELEKKLGKTNSEIGSEYQVFDGRKFLRTHQIENEYEEAGSSVERESKIFDTSLLPDTNDVDQCFNLLKNKLINSSAEKYFLYILQLLMNTPDNYSCRPSYYNIIEECISKIVFYQRKTVLHSDRKTHLYIDVETALEALTERARRKIEDKLRMEFLKQNLNEINEELHQLNLEIEATESSSSTEV